MDYLPSVDELGPCLTHANQALITLIEYYRLTTLPIELQYWFNIWIFLQLIHHSS